ncbi:MAG: sodium-dependent transporter [Candidatus Aminicenantes bacterium]|nr:sodium-dependent transporter [Candidatus Aminicenantes bacterium]
MTMVGVAIGLGNIWRFPYMVGKYGGSAFVLFYLIAVIVIGIPALMAEWTLGRLTQRGPLGAFEKGGFPKGKYVGGFFFFVIICGAAYYSNTLGWVAYFGISQIINALGGNINPGSILPPEAGFNTTSFFLQLLMTGLVILACGIVLIRGLRKGIERASKFIMPTLFFILIILIARSVTLPGSGEGLKWYIGKFRIKDLTGSVMGASLGQAIFSLSLGGTFMVIYGSYLKKSISIQKNAVFTGLGDLIAGLMAGFMIFPAVFAFNLEPASGPGLIFDTLPRTFSMMPAGWIFGTLFFLGLFGAAYLSDVAAFEVLVSGLRDNTTIKRTRAVWLIGMIVFLTAIPTMINMKIFLPWDLTFGSGMQILGTLLAVITTVWCIKKSEALKELAKNSHRPFHRFLFWWLRIVIPIVILFVGVNWLLESAFHIKILR